MPFDIARFTAEREARGGTLGAAIRWAELTASTNDDALSAARAGAAHGALFGAETQTLGRGRRGSEWFSEAGAGLWFSVLLRPALAAEAAPVLALCAGLSVREAVAKHVASRVLVKWPNDVLVAPGPLSGVPGGADHRKVAGVLVESQITGSRLSWAVVGIGLNVLQTAFPEAISTTATSLELLQAGAERRETLLAHVLEAFETRVTRLETRGMVSVAEELRQHDALLGRRLRVDERSGTGAGIDDSGRLLLQLESGTVDACVSGHIELLG